MYIWITLQEPEKSILLPYFLADTEPPAGSVPRKSFTILVDPNTGKTHEAVVEIRGPGDATLESLTELPEGLDSMFAADELAIVGDLALLDPRVIQRLAVYGDIFTNTSHVVTDVW
jgi:hypothetical protein